MKIECPHCGGHYDVDPQYIGQTLKCPDCGNEIEVNNPNLIPCPDCFVPISRRANCCPHCGAVLKAPEMTTIRLENQTSSTDFASEKEVMVCHPGAMNYLWAIILGIITLPFIIGILILLYVWIEIHYTTYCPPRLDWKTAKRNLDQRYARSESGAGGMATAHWSGKYFDWKCGNSWNRDQHDWNFQPAEGCGHH